MLGVLMIHIVMDIFEITISMVNYLLYVIIITSIYGIKIIRKMPIFLTHTTAKLNGQVQVVLFWLDYCSKPHETPASAM
jgi:hypothetical protein